jgi:hypothetical protein
MSYAPAGYRAEDVPEIRDWLLADLTTGDTGDALDRYEEFCVRLLNRPAPTTRGVELAGLEAARLFWVPPAESTVLGNARADLPSDLILTEDFMPCPSGFVVFAAPFYGIDSLTGTQMEVPMRAFRWGPVSLPTKYSETGRGTEDAEIVGGVALSAYTYLPEARGSRQAIEDFVQFFYKGVHDDPVAQALAENILIEEAVEEGNEHTPSVWTPLGRTDWELGQSWKDHRFFDDESNVDKINRESIIEDRRLAAALWAFMGACEPVYHAPSRAEHRRAARRGREAASVRVVTWRGPQGQTVDTSPLPSESGRHVGVRYLVHSHWRNQAYGTGRLKRKYILIPQHWRGPQDAPLSNPHETITKIVGRK